MDDEILHECKDFLKNGNFFVFVGLVKYAIMCTKTFFRESF